MEKIINGKRYNTDTAKYIGGNQYSDSSNFEYWREELYQKKTGEFFLSCEGGPNSKYGVWQGNTGGYGYQLKPLSLQEAQAWVEKYLSADEYEETFGRVEEGKVQISSWVSDDLKRMADELREKGYTLADIFEAGVNSLK